MNNTPADTSSPSSSELRRIVYSRFAIALVVLPLFFFIPAGTIRYWEAWVYLAILLIPVFFVMRYLLKHDPAFLERRMRTREQQRPQKLVIASSFAWFFLAFILPGLDQRFGWSDVPVAAVLAADLLVLLGYGVILRVFRENRYASRVVEVAEGQPVIQTGPYAVVRHPMYVGTLLMYLATPVALGSWWALLPALLIVPILVARIVNEEKVLAENLPGYPEYMQKTRYRLIPGVW
jgi:protein-S-isoprenylcysteine O-methyltransferase Ste14